MVKTTNYNGRVVSFSDTQLHYFSDFVFIFRYHDMPDVLDFLILRQTYDESISRNWRPGGLVCYVWLLQPTKLSNVSLKNSCIKSLPLVT